MGNFRSTEQGENFKSSETWLNLFKIIKKNRNQFLERYMQMFKSYSNLKISKFLFFYQKAIFVNFFG